MENWERNLNDVHAPQGNVPSHRDALRAKLQGVHPRPRVLRNSMISAALVLVLGMTGLTVANPDWAERLYRIIRVEEYKFKTDDGREVHIKTVEAEAGPNAVMGEWQTDASGGNVIYELQAGDPRRDELLAGGEKLERVLHLEAEVSGEGGPVKREQQIMMMRTDDGDVWVINGDTVTSAGQIAALESHHGMIERMSDDAALDSESPQQSEIAHNFELHQNYPNPFNPTTNITFDLDEPMNVMLRVFDVTGREVALLLDGPRAAGSHTVTFDGRDLSSGTYFYTLHAGGLAETKQMVLMK